ncbi:MAG: hypothetical protein VKK94_01785 [Cyanobacteriota bacterium]|nr:hypothetical protein [Cyanobacteriota bacterium]
MLPMLLVFALSSGLLQQGVNRLLEGRFSGKELWLVLGQAGFQRYTTCITFAIPHSGWIC